MKSSSCIYLIHPSPIFNIDDTPAFEFFDKANSVLLYSALFFNHKENIDLIEKNFPAVFCFDYKDKDFIPQNLNALHKHVFCDTSKEIEPFRILADKYFGLYTNNLIIFSLSIGFSSAEIKKVFDLLEMDDEAIVIGKSTENKVVFIGFNKYNKDIFENLNCKENNFENFLAMANKHENFVHVMGNYIFLKNLNDFKQLYVELGKKESWAYCSQIIHEQFTHLFIEYKDSLK
jgi:hypothetical protein